MAKYIIICKNINYGYGPVARGSSEVFDSGKQFESFTEAKNLAITNAKTFPGMNYKVAKVVGEAEKPLESDVWTDHV